MRAMAVTDYGKPLELLEVPEPQVTPGHALLEVTACGVCFSDVKTSRGHMPYSGRLTLPHVPGHEVFGRVLRTEPDGLVQPGTGAIVFHYWPCGRCRACRRGDETLCTSLVAWMGFTHPGGFRERITVPIDRLIPVPPSVDPIHAAPMSCALGTAYRAVVSRGGVRPGMGVAVVGLGGVGIHAAQIARASGADVTGFDVHEATIGAAGQLGIRAVRSDGPDGQAAVRDANLAGGLDLVVDTVGREATLAMSERLVRPGGRIVGVGYSPTSAVRVATPRFVLDEIELVGSRYAHRDDMERAIRLVVDGRVETVVGMVRPLQQVNEVFDALEAGSVLGRAVLDVSGAA